MLTTQQPASCQHHDQQNTANTQRHQTPGLCVSALQHTTQIRGTEHRFLPRRVTKLTNADWLLLGKPTAAGHKVYRTARRQESVQERLCSNMVTSCMTQGDEYLITSTQWAVPNDDRESPPVTIFYPVWAHSTTESVSMRRPRSLRRHVFFSRPESRPLHTDTTNQEWKSVRLSNRAATRSPGFSLGEAKIHRHV